MTGNMEELRKKLGKLFEKREKNNDVTSKSKETTNNLKTSKNNKLKTTPNVSNVKGKKDNAKVQEPKSVANTKNAKATTTASQKPKNVPVQNGKKPSKGKKQNSKSNVNVNGQKQQKQKQSPSPKSTQKSKKRFSKELVPQVPKKKSKKDVESDDDSSDYSPGTISFESESESDWSGWSEEEDYTESDDANNSSSFYFDTESDSNYEDYRLPKDVPEDLIIHKGLAQIHPLSPKDHVNFDDTDSAQIVELDMSSTLKTVEQPKAFDRDEMMKLSDMDYEPIHSTKIGRTKDDDDDSTQDCPKLVPIADSNGYDSSMDEDDGFRPYDEFSESSLSSSYEECTDDESIISLDINSKYLHDYDDSSEGEECQVAHMKANIVCAKNSMYSAVSKIPMNAIECVEIDALPQPEVVNNLSKVRIVETAVMEPIAAETSLDETADSIASQISPDDNIDSPMQLDTSSSTITTNKFYNAIDSNRVLVLLREPIYIYGTVRLTLLAGNVQVYGYKPSKNIELEIFSPRGCAAVDIQPVANIITQQDELASTLNRLRELFVQTDLNSVESEFGHDSDALLLFQRNVECRKQVAFITKHMNENVFPKVKTRSSKSERPHYASEYLLNCFINTTSEKSLRIPHMWSDLQLKAASSRHMIIGGKGVGKSTLVRYMTNRYLQQPTDRILLIDLDIGQPELFVPQTISCSVLTGNKPLLGPGFLQNHQPAKSYALGHINVLHCAKNYVHAVRQLMEFCCDRNEYGDMPWIINTMGYNKGFGLELIAVLIEIVKPTDVIQIQSNRDINNFDTLLKPEVLPHIPRHIFGDLRTKAHKIEYHLHVKTSAVQQQSRYQREWDMSAKDLRYVMMLSRLSDVLQGNAEWLSDGKPLTASLERIKLVNLCNSQSTVNELQLAIETQLVYLCHYVDDNQPLECLGIGVVRAIDYVTQQLFLMPAMPCERMSSINCLGLGETPLPTSLFINQGPKVSGTTPFVYSTIDGNVSKSIQQIYFRPAEFLTGKHTTTLD